MAQRKTKKSAGSRTGKPASTSRKKASASGKVPRSSKPKKKSQARTSKADSPTSTGSSSLKSTDKSASPRSSSSRAQDSPTAREASNSGPAAETPQDSAQSGWEWPGPQLRRGIGVALLGLAGAGRFTAGSEQVVPGPDEELPAEPVMDVALGAVDVGLAAAERVANSIRHRLNPILGAALAPAATPAAGLGMNLLQRVTEPLAERGRRLRVDSEHEAAAAVAGVLPETIELVMEQIDLTQLAIDNVDIRRVLEATVAQVDMTQFAVDTMDLPRVVTASLDSVDLTEIAIDRIDFARTVPEVLDQVDVLGMARDQVDPARLAAFIRDNVDLTETIKIDPTAVAGDAVRGVTKRARRIVGGGSDD